MRLRNSLLDNENLSSDPGDYTVRSEGCCKRRTKKDSGVVHTPTEREIRKGFGRVYDDLKIPG